MSTVSLNFHYCITADSLCGDLKLGNHFYNHYFSTGIRLVLNDYVYKSSLVSGTNFHAMGTNHMDKIDIGLVFFPGWFLLDL